MLRGLYQPDFPGWGPDLEPVESAMGRKIDLANWFHNAGNPYRDDHVQTVLDHGAIPMLTLQPQHWHLRAALNGRYDREIRDFGNAIAEHGPETILLRWAHEGNGRGWYPWQVDPGLYRAVWERTRLLITNRAPQVQFVFCVNKDYRGATPIRDLWPGDEQVEVCAIDAYNMPHVVGKWREPDELFDETLRQIRSLWDGPVWIAETGCVADPRRADWIRNLKRWCVESGVGASVYFNAHGSSGDYRLSPEELRILGDALAD